MNKERLEVNFSADKYWNEFLNIKDYNWFMDIVKNSKESNWLSFIILNSWPKTFLKLANKNKVFTINNDKINDFSDLEEFIY